MELLCIHYQSPTLKKPVRHEKLADGTAQEPYMGVPPIPLMQKLTDALLLLPHFFQPIEISDIDAFQHG
jgi:hypothetical protein